LTEALYEIEEKTSFDCQVFAGLKKKKDRDSLIAYLEESTAS